MRVFAAALLVIVAACGRNPAFDAADSVGEAAGSGSSSGSASSSSAASPTTTADSGSSTTTPPPGTTSETGEPTTTGVLDGTTTGTTGADTTTGVVLEQCPQDFALVACYPFPPGETAVLVDASPGGHDGVMSGVALADSVTAEHGTAGQFGLMTSDASIPHDLGFTSPVATVALFARVPKVPERKTLIDKGEQYGLFVEDGLLSCIMVLTPPLDGSRAESVALPIPTDQWIHVACVFTSSELRLVVHPGGPVLTAEIPTIGALYPSQLEVGVGHNVPAGDEDLVGLLDHILFYTRPLSDDELCTLAGSLCES